ncbi:MAG TPA: glycosyltransferase family 39 protein [Planctomycetaceae bacterium]|jgi:4-amino-4-deoxy-L-arabinose transferase-like glycosyltransferase|nr:glycosyltransferase family 39 protein [Planctomycetaceae bacterium]
MSRRKREVRRRATSKSQPAEASEAEGWSPRAARPPIERGEKLAIGVLFVAAIALRFSYQSRISIEHWDEAVNASNVFLEGGYPNRFLYSPPLLPTLIELSMLALGKTPLAAVMPSLVLGSFAIPLCWWVGREWFGPIAGIAAAALAALSDFQIVYSRTGLTDAALGFWFLLAVYCCWRALARNHLGEAVVAGLAVACAWATKYNGWLPLAVALSGFIAWGLFERFDRREWFARLPVVVTLVVATAIGWSPVWLSLQPDGGYTAVTANHAQYFFGVRGWWDDFKRQILNQRFYEGWLTAAGMILAWMLPVIIQRSRAVGPTGGSTAESEAQPPSEPGEAGDRAVISRGLLREADRRIHLLTVAAFLAGVSLLIGWLGFSAVFAVLFLVFVGSATFLRPRFGNQEPEAARARNLAGWLLAAWFLGLFVAIPLYKPYPRLVMPWLVCAWLAGGACVAGLLTWAAERRAARDAARALPSRFDWRMWGLLVGAIGVLALGVVSRLSLARARDIPGWQDRTVRANIIKQAAQFARKRAPGKPVFLVYGEPCLFFDLAVEGFDPQPPLGGDFSFLGPGQKPLPQPAFLLAYEGTADFDKLIAPYTQRLTLEAVFHDTPSDLVLLDTYSPADLAPGQPRPREVLNLYRINPR